MLLRKRRLGQGSRVITTALLGAIVVLALAGRATSAATPEAEAAFCQSTPVRDYLAPLKALPKLRAPSTTGHIGMGLRRLRMESLPQLAIGKQQIGFSLTLRKKGPVLKRDWIVTTTLERVNSSGRPVEMLRRTRSEGLRVLSNRHDFGVSFWVEKPDLYRVSVSFNTADGREIGELGFYFRAVPRTHHARLVLDATTYRAGDTVLGRIENFGTDMVIRDGTYAIERLEGSTWTPTTVSPEGARQSIYSVIGGETGKDCIPFPIPSTMAPGHYRMTKIIIFHSNFFPPRIFAPTARSAEFDVIP